MTGPSAPYLNQLMSTSLLVAAAMAKRRPIPLAEIPSAGVSLGEIVAYRVWLLQSDFITSCSMDDVWRPGEIMVGRFLDRGAGVHAWRSPELAVCYGKQAHYCIRVVGRVALWGEVIEHERGYRAEFAKPIAFDQMFGYPILPGRRLRKLRELYGLEAAR